MSNELAAVPPRSIITEMAHSFGMERAAFEQTLKKTIMPSNVEATNEQISAFLIVAKEYKLNPFTKEIYAFPAKGGGIQPVVSIDGWLNIINSHPMMDGMELLENFENGRIHSVTCRIHRKDRKYPTVITEYLSECERGTDQWKQKPKRMLTHKATIQGGRYAFGFAGIIDPDEADRMIEMGELTVVPQAQRATIERQRELAMALAGEAIKPVDEIATVEIQEIVKAANDENIAGT